VKPASVHRRISILNFRQVPFDQHTKNVLNG
jgi:hypothetical protein